MANTRHWRKGRESLSEKRCYRLITANLDNTKTNEDAEQIHVVSVKLVQAFWKNSFDDHSQGTRRTQ